MSVFRLTPTVPIVVQHAVVDYVQDRLPPGAFVAAVLANELAAAVFAADRESLRHLSDIVRYTQEVVPPTARGSRLKVAQWLDHHAG